MAERKLNRLGDGALTYPGIESREHPDGREYVVASPSIDDGLQFTQLVELGLSPVRTAEQLEKLNFDDSDERTLYQKILGPTFDAMRADGVTWERMRQVALDALFYFGGNQAIADALLEGQGKAQEQANRAQRRAAKKAAKATPKPTGSAKPAGSSSSRARTGRAKAPASGATPARTTGRASTRASRTAASTGGAAKTA